MIKPPASSTSRRPPPGRPASAARKAALAAAMALAVLAPAAPARALDSALFPLPAELEANVDFWTRVYSEYDSHQVLLHDELYLHVIYAVLDFTALDASTVSAGRQAAVRREEITKATAKYRTLLNNLAAGRASKSFADEQARIERLFESVPGDRGRYAAAAGRLRTQTCLKDQFAAGIERSGVYMAAIERIFESHGLPLELTRLPFVESLFQWNARSSAAAGGIWQFMPGSARLYRLEMNLELDERYDPLRATDAAARHLKDNYAALGNWPLAVTAYNHGPAGVRRAVRQLGTRDLGEIVRRYRSRFFGFASRNFYSELIAAARIYDNRQQYFPGVEPAPALAFDEFEPPHYVPLAELAKSAGSRLDTLKAMNPALASAVWSGNVYLPRGYKLLVPAGQGPAFEAAYAALPDDRKSAHQVGHYYRVRSGDTLSKIADKFGTSLAALQRANNLRSVHRISIGQRILIPPGSGARPAAATAVAARSAPGTHVVRKGETLASIARLYRTTVRAIQSANRIRGHIILPAQVLVIP